jgi:hypothetical protein
MASLTRSWTSRGAGGTELVILAGKLESATSVLPKDFGAIRIDVRDDFPFQPHISRQICTGI